MSISFRLFRLSCFAAGQQILHREYLNSRAFFTWPFSCEVLSLAVASCANALSGQSAGLLALSALLGLPNLVLYGGV